MDLSVDSVVRDYLEHCSVQPRLLANDLPPNPLDLLRVWRSDAAEEWREDPRPPARRTPLPRRRLPRTTTPAFAGPATLTWSREAGFLLHLIPADGRGDGASASTILLPSWWSLCPDGRNDGAAAPQGHGSRG